MDNMGWLVNALAILSGIEGSVALMGRGAKAYKYISGIVRGPRIRATIERVDRDRSRTPIDIVEVAPHILYTPSITQVTAVVDSPIIPHPDRNQMSVVLRPFQSHMGGDLLSTAWVGAPPKVQELIAINPDQLLYEVTPLHLAKPANDPYAVPIIFARDGGIWVGWQKTALLVPLFGLQYNSDPSGQFAHPSPRIIDMKPTPKAGDPLTITVSGSTSIQSAIDAVSPGGMVYVLPGTYHEKIVLSKSVHVLGEGERGSIIIRTTAVNAVHSTAENATLKNLSIHQDAGIVAAGESVLAAVNIAAGNLSLVECEITSSSGSCVAVHSKANPKVEGCRIHHSNDFGIHVFDHGEGLFTNNKVFDHRLACISVATWGNPIVRSCEITNGKLLGIFVWDEGQGVFEENQISDNTRAGVAIVSEGSNPTIRNCRIFGGQGIGALVSNLGQGVIEGCSIYDNAVAGVQVMQGGNPTVRKCHIYSNRNRGVSVHEKGVGQFIGNDIHSNVGAGVSIFTGGDPKFSECRIHHGVSRGIHVYDGGIGWFYNNVISDNAGDNICITTNGKPKVLKNIISKAGEYGANIHSNGEGDFRNNDISENLLAGVLVTRGGKPCVNNNTIHDGKSYGIDIGKDGKGTFKNNRLYRNRSGDWNVTGKPQIFASGNISG